MSTSIDTDQLVVLRVNLCVVKNKYPARQPHHNGDDAIREKNEDMPLFAYMILV